MKTDIHHDNDSVGLFELLINVLKIGLERSFQAQVEPLPDDKTFKFSKIIFSGIVSPDFRIVYGLEHGQGHFGEIGKQDFALLACQRLNSVLQHIFEDTRISATPVSPISLNSYHKLFIPEPKYPVLFQKSHLLKVNNEHLRIYAQCEIIRPTFLFRYKPQARNLPEFFDFLEELDRMLVILKKGRLGGGKGTLNRQKQMKDH